MEIADIFVINKADHPGVEQTRKEIESMLSLASAPTPPIFKTIAIDGTGVADVADELERRKPKQHAQGEQSASIDHLGIAVRSIDGALPFYSSHLNLPIAARETVAHEKVNVAMLPVGESRIELLEPLDPESTIAKFIEKRGPGLHHVAIRVPDLDAAIDRLTAAGAKLLGKPQRGAGGHLYVFVHPASAGGVLWELIQG
jgi:LAO/AO transport system kinase